MFHFKATLALEKFSFFYLSLKNVVLKISGFKYDVLVVFNQENRRSSQDSRASISDNQKKSPRLFTHLLAEELHARISHRLSFLHAEVLYLDVF